VAAALLLAGCAAQNAYREGQTLLAEEKVDAGLAKIQEAMLLDPLPSSIASAIPALRTRDQCQPRPGRTCAGRGCATPRPRPPTAARCAAAGQRACAGRFAADRERRRHDLLFQEAEQAWAKKDAKGAGAPANDPDREPETRARAGPATPDRRERRQGARESVLTAAFRKPITIEFRDTPLKTVFEVISRTSGLNFVFDKDCAPIRKRPSFCATAPSKPRSTSSC
jgi:general secretion pathway protein D